MRSADFERELVQTLRSRALQRSDSLEFRFRRRYGLAPHDPRYLACTVEDMALDLMAHRFCDDPRTREEMVTDDFEQAFAEFEQEVDAETPIDLPDDFEEVIPA